MLLQGKKGLVVGVANEMSIAWGCAQNFIAEGAKLAITYQNEKTKSFVAPLAKLNSCPIFMPLNVTDDLQMADLFATIEEQWDGLDFIVHSIAFAPKQDIQGRLVDSTKEGFGIAMDISVHSLMRLAKSALPLMKNGGSILTISFYGAHKVVPNYNLMGPVKAALECSVKYLAYELGAQKIRVNSLSSGPVATRAASGLSHFDKLMEQSVIDAPLHQLVSLEQIGNMASFLVSDKSQQITGQIHYVDAGYNLV